MKCVTEGNPVHWSSPCLYYAVQRDGSPKAGIDAEAFRQAIDAAFDVWASARCPGGGSPRFRAQFQGLVGCHRKEAVCGGPSANVNVMMFQDTAWPSDTDVIGLTTPTGGSSSGLLVDADLQLDSQNFDFSEAGKGPRPLRLSYTLSHEVGHFLGLDHTMADGALMSVHYEMIEPGASLLSDDDVAAICAAYPPGDALDCPAPEPPAYDECQLAAGEVPKTCQLASMNHDQSGGCQVAAGAERRPGGAALAFAIFGFGLLRRRRYDPVLS